MQPLKITAWPRCGIVSDRYLPIDSILFYVAMRDRYGAQTMTTPGQLGGNPPVDLPIEKRIVQGEWFYAASFLQCNHLVDGRGFWVKRFDQKHADFVDFGERRGRVIVEQGTYKAYHMPFFDFHALSIFWYVFGDKEKIEGLLQHVTHIGKKTSQGNGRIIRWQVEACTDDWSVYDGNSRPMRAVPSETGMLYGIRPPYWLRENQVTAVLPEVPGPAVGGF